MKSMSGMKPFGIIVLVVILSIVFVEPVRNYLNNLFRRDKSELNEERIVGMTFGYNPQIEELQRILRDANFDPGPADGIMGAQTRRAIRDFQKAKGLKLTGKIDSATHLVLIREKESLANHKKKAESEAMQKIADPQNSVIREELPQDRIKRIQSALQKAGFYKGKIDGKIGPQTKRAIKAFQRVNGLKANGIVGKRTAEKLNKYLP